MGLSIRAYARHRGVSHVAVKKAIDSGRITQNPDGTIDADTADQDWQRNTLPPTASKAVPLEATRTVRETLNPADQPGKGLTLLNARTASEVIKAQLGKVRLSQIKACHRSRENWSIARRRLRMSSRWHEQNAMPC